MKKITFVLALIIGVSTSASQVSAQTYQSFYGYAKPSTCVNLTQNLSLGSRSTQVTQLQSFLADRNYPGGGAWMVTGYFGAATRAALRNFQQEMGIAQTGMLDAVTRDAISRVSCGSGYANQTQYPYLYTSTPSYAYNYNTFPYNYTNSGTYPYTHTPAYVPPYTSGCNTNYNYGSAGWYAYNNCGTGTNASISIQYISPISGAVGDTVTVYGTGFSARDNTVNFGIGIISGLTSVDGRSVSFTVPAQLTGYGTHVTTIDTYSVAVTNAAGQRSNSVSYTVTSLGASGRPTISNISGPTSIAAGTSGVWTIQAYNPGSNYLSVSVNWGDQSAYPYAAASAAQSIYLQGTQTLTFNHVYQTAGTYTITFTATNASGQSSIVTSTVTVTGSSTTGGTPTISYLAPVSGSVGTTVTIYGTNFSQWGNTVRFGNGAITNVASTNGTTITFTVPTYLSPYCPLNYACAMYAQVVSPGVYPVSVINGNGLTSNASTFTVQ
ncbi:peptidoglycan-binding protein [Candidatus Kaiserbacteria bacterium]|nr:peptidoglycan-binding protein [Candidatus Kaiserbacteria bacterium]